MLLMGSACLAAFYIEGLSGRKTWWKLVGWESMADSGSGLDRWEAVRNLDPQSRLVASQSGQQSARWSNQVEEQQTTNGWSQAHMREGPIIKAGQEVHEVQCHNLPSLVTASVHLDFQVRRQMNPITLTSGGNDFPIYGPGRACGQ